MKREVKSSVAHKNPLNLPVEFFLRQIRAQKIAPVYILFGAEHPGKDEFVSILKSAGKFTLETIQINREDANKTDLLSEIIAKITTQSLWGDRILILIRDFQNLSPKYQQEILNRVKSLPMNYANTVVIESKYSREIGEMFNQCKLPLINFYELDTGGVHKYLHDIAKALGLLIDYDASKLLLDLVGTDFALLKSEIVKIKTFLGERHRITVDDVLSACGYTKESSLDDLINATFLRNKQDALSNLFQFKDDPKMPIIIVSSLANIAFQIMQVLLGTDTSTMGISKKRLVNLEKQSRLWTKEELSAFITELAEIDKQIKTGYPEPFVLLENLLVKTGKDFESSRVSVIN
ncbi:MAG: DNA polymerase III subunit delta [candidate division WOR-3 bacterium]|nr:DNA polymerase III subunit delta [candidate division WOR-3 bacterium]